MEDTIRYGNDQYGHDDYAQLDRWSPHIAGSGYKQPLTDNSSLIYTSDYGSYSSQESNHSGTTYSNLADCEEALHSPPSVAYDVPPQLFGSMEKRRDKPLPPPRMTSKVQMTNRTRILEPVKEKRISFDDSSMHKHLNGEKTNPNDSIPSFATLPRKKKLGSGTTSNAAPSPPAAQVTWMKEVAQKGESIAKSKSANPADPGTNKPNWKPHGILKNKKDDNSQKRGDTTGYIKRNTVQRILDQQKKALNRQSTAAPAPPFYKSMPSLKPALHSESGLSPHKAWEYGFSGNTKLEVTTAQVIGIFEPNVDGSSSTHSRQNSAETEFEFPAPPSDHDIEKLMSPEASQQLVGIERQNSSNNDFTPLQLACSDGGGGAPLRSLSRSQSSTTNATSNTRHLKQSPKPPVPQRSKKPAIVENPSHLKFREQTSNQPQNIAPNYESTIPSREKRIPVKRVSVQSPQEQTITVTPKRYGNKPAAAERSHIKQSETAEGVSTGEIVLPPPPEFQEITATPLSTPYPSYGDYELLSSDAQYEYPVNTLPPFSNNLKINSKNEEQYNGSLVTQQLETMFTDSVKVTPYTKPHAKIRNYGYSTTNKVNGFSASMYRGAVNQENTQYASPHYQYSTEL